MIKVDTKEKKCLTFAEPNLYASEPIFVPHPNAKVIFNVSLPRWVDYHDLCMEQNEDDGVVLSSLIWGGPNEQKAGMIVLDASTFTELGRAEFSTISEVPKCLHGYFLPNV